MEYTIRRMHGTPALPLARNLEFFPDGLAAPWSALEEAEISVYPWDETGYRPQSRARLGWTPEGLYVLMYSREKAVSYTHLDVYKRQLYGLRNRFHRRSRHNG